MRKRTNLILLPILIVLILFLAFVVSQNLRLNRVMKSDAGAVPVPEASVTPEVTPTPTPTSTPTPTPTPEPVYVQTIPENALWGMIPDPEGYHESMDASDLSSFLRMEEVQELIGDKTLLWNPEIVRYPDTPVRWYFDETILCIVWQEVEAQAVGTFSEVIIADGSQLRRKISADIGIYQREFYRFDPKTCDTCYITSDGDMLFSYRNQFTEQAQAEQFAAENDVLFSLVFGPVLIDNGQDVTPELYPWGEVTDTYARAALGLLERHHYLTMNINCAQPGTEYYNLATLRQEADAMLKRGCWKAYALDGGQTATTVFGGQLINPVQFGQEKEISDIIYFASAHGGEKKELPRS